MNRFLIVLWFPVSLPAVMFVRLIRPFLLIRFSDFLAYSMGMMTGSFAIYLCQEKKEKCLDVFFMGNTCNQQFVKMAKRIFPGLIRWPYSFFKSAEWLNRKIPGGKDHQIYQESAYTDRDLDGLLDRIPTEFKFDSDEEKIGQQELRKLGIPEGSSFVCLIVRDDGYFKYLKPGYDDFENSSRNSDIDNFILACEYLVDCGYYVVRMGAKVLKPLPMKHFQIIDYAYEGKRTDFMDIYLGAKCAFCISTGTGWDNVPTHVFRKPAVYVNLAHPGKAFTFSNRFILIMKKFFSRNEKCVLSMKEMFRNNLGFYIQDTSELMAKNIEWLENSPEEICDVVSEMVQRLGGTWKTKPEDEELQRRFWEIFPSKCVSRDYGVLLHGEIRARFGSEFLRKNHEWFLK